MVCETYHAAAAASGRRPQWRPSVRASGKIQRGTIRERLRRRDGDPLNGADLRRAILRGARYDYQTRWPARWDPREHGAMLYVH